MTQEARLGFRERPFQAALRDELFVPLEPMDAAVEQLVGAARTGDGIGVLTATPGAGKTVVCREVQARLAQEFVTVLLPSCGFPTRRAMLQAILYEMGSEYAGLSEQETRLQLLQAAQAMRPQFEGLVLIADEAHQLSPRLLEELRCLTNHVEQGRPLIRVLLSGQLALEELLTRPELQSLNYRITCHQALEPLTLRQSARYVEERLRHVGGEARQLFFAEALEMICRISDGNPRCLNQLADACLTHAGERGEVPLPASAVRIVLRDLKQLPLQWNDSACDEVPEDGEASLPAADRPASASGCEPGPPERQDADHDQPVSETRMTADMKQSAEPTWMNQVATIEIGADETSAVDAAKDRPASPPDASPAVATAGHAAQDDELQEWQVADRYAALDRNKQAALAGVYDDTSIDWPDSRTSAPAQAHEPAIGDREPLPAGQDDVADLTAVDDDEHDEHTGARIDRVIQVVSDAVSTEMSGHFADSHAAPAPAAHARQEETGGPQDRWRAAPVSSVFDLVHPEPSKENRESSLGITDAAEMAPPPTSTPAADAPVGDDAGPGASAAEARPYARLFSQARRLRIRAS